MWNCCRSCNNCWRWYSSCRERNVLFNDALNTFYLWFIWRQTYGKGPLSERGRKEGRKEMFYLTTHSTHFIYGYMVSDIWLRTTQRKEGRKEGNVLFNDALNTFYLRLYGVRHMVKDHSDSEKGTRCRHIGYAYRLAAQVLLYAPSHRQDSTYHSLCYTSCGALAGMRNGSMGPPHEGSIQRPIAPWVNALTTELHLAPWSEKCSTSCGAQAKDRKKDSRPLALCPWWSPAPRSASVWSPAFSSESRRATPPDSLSSFLLQPPGAETHK